MEKIKNIIFGILIILFAVIVFSFGMTLVREGAFNFNPTETFIVVLLLGSFFLSLIKFGWKTLKK